MAQDGGRSGTRSVSTTRGTLRPHPSPRDRPSPTQKAGEYNTEETRSVREPTVRRRCSRRKGTRPSRVSRVRRQGDRRRTGGRNLQPPLGEHGSRTEPVPNPYSTTRRVLSGSPVVHRGVGTGGKRLRLGPRDPHPLSHPDPDRCRGGRESPSPTNTNPTPTPTPPRPRD